MRLPESANGTDISPCEPIISAISHNQKGHVSFYWLFSILRIVQFIIGFFHNMTRTPLISTPHSLWAGPFRSVTLRKPKSGIQPSQIPDFGPGLCNQHGTVLLRFIPTPVGRTGPGCPGCFPDRHVPYSYFTPIHAPWPECLYPNTSLSHSACFDEIIHLFSSPCLSLAVASSIYICLYVVYILFFLLPMFYFFSPKTRQKSIKNSFSFLIPRFFQKTPFYNLPRFLLSLLCGTCPPFAHFFIIYSFYV